MELKNKPNESTLMDSFHLRLNRKRREVRRVYILTKSLVHHGLLLLFIALFIHQRTEGVPVTDTEDTALLYRHKLETGD